MQGSLQKRPGYVLCYIGEPNKRQTASATRWRSSKYIQMRVDKLLLILCIWCSAVTALPSCSDYDTLSEPQLWKIIQPSTFQLYFTLSAGTLSVLGLVLTLCTWRVYKSFEIPSDIMFAICWAELFENSSLVASSAYFLANKSQDVPDGFRHSCTAISVFYTMGNTSSLIYNVLFCLVLSLSVKKTLKGTFFSQARYHTSILLIVLAITLALLLTEALGAGLTGVCGYRVQNRESIARFIMEILVVCLCVFCMHAFRSKVPKSTYFRQVAVFGYYYYYMGLFCVIQLLSSVGYLVGNIACRSGSPYTAHIIDVSVTFGSCESIALSYVLIFMRFAHPVMRSKIRRLWHKMRGIEELYGQDIEDEPWLGSLLESIKASQIISFLTATLVSFAQQQRRASDTLTVSKFNFKKNYLIRLSESVTDQYILKKVGNRESLVMKQKLDGLRSLEYNVTAYAIEVFADLLSCEPGCNIFQSFNINLNIPLVRQKSCTNGGKSGEFFFGTHDHKFLIKTVTEDEATLYLEKMTQFYQYFQNNPASLISKILGLYKFMRNDIQEQPIYLILMKNISPYDRALQERVYDIKGSEFNRSTIDEKKIENPEKLRNHTLKDEDFMKLERRICIEPQYSTHLKAQLKKDAEFLGKMGVMDYSILIIKRRGPKRDEHYTPPAGKHNQLPCYAERDLYYNIGIIDYLESWTLKRKAERAFKSMITKKKVTVQSPEQYSLRLSQFIDQII